MPAGSPRRRARSMTLSSNCRSRTRSARRAAPRAPTRPFPQPINGAIGHRQLQGDGSGAATTRRLGPRRHGRGRPNDGSALLDIDNSSLVEIGGPVYLQNPARTVLKKTVQIVDGDLWHPNTLCAESDPTNPAIQYKSSTLSISKLTYSAGRGPYCINRTWQQLFGAGPTISSNVATMQANIAAWNPPYTVNGSCRVFSPGYYTSLNLGASNYFRSGEYVFDNIGTVSLPSST